MRTADSTDLVLLLHEADEGDAARVGPKAATLARLTRAGFPVPEALVLTSRAAGEVLRSARLGPDALPLQVLAAPLPASVEAALATIVDHFGDAVLAVRSSAAAEDQPDSSFAGQYETVLHVRGIVELRDAVRRCWASAYDDRVRAYRGGSGSSGAAPIAVIVQRQVDADVAGVAFTANPVSGDRDEVLVSAVPGLGDALVSGHRPPDEWTVRGSATTAVRVVHQALAAEQARAVAALALRIEALLGAPQDVEWAMAGGRLVVLQARPITALPRKPVAEVPAGTWLKDVEHYPEPFTALGASLAAPAVAEGLSSMFAAWGGLLDRMETLVIGGEVYVRPVPVGGHEGPPPPWWVLGLLARLAPPMRRRVRTAGQMMRPEVFEGLLEKWKTGWQPEFASAVARLGAVRRDQLDDRALDAYLGSVVDLVGRALHVHFHLIPLYTVPPHDLVEVCRDLLGYSEPEALTLVAGTSVASSEPTRALAELAGQIGACPPARAAVERAGADIADRLRRADADLGAGFAEWCEQYGARCVNNDPGSPVFTERPWLLAALLREALAAHDAGKASTAERAGAARAEATKRAHSALSGRPAADRKRFEQALATALRYYPLREDTVFWLARISGLGRLAALEAGRRLAARGDTDRHDDAVHLDIDTLRAALVAPAPADLRARVGQARAEQAWTSRNPGPASYGPPPGGLPDVRGLPGPARRLNAALQWAQPRGHEPQEPSAGVLLRGMAASPGRHTGPVRVIRGEADFTRLRRGEVLVAPTTDPAWSVLFGVAGALVTDGGGVLSHAAIVAREHAIPAVVGTSTATAALNDGDLVTVDGTTGCVVAAIAAPTAPGAVIVEQTTPGVDSDVAPMQGGLS